MIILFTILIKYFKSPYVSEFCNVFRDHMTSVPNSSHTTFKKNCKPFALLSESHALG